MDCPLALLYLLHLLYLLYLLLLLMLLLDLDWHLGLWEFGLAGVQKMNSLVVRNILHFHKLRHNRLYWAIGTVGCRGGQQPFILRWLIESKGKNITISLLPLVYLLLWHYLGITARGH